MQCRIAVTPMGNRRSCPPRKPVLSEGTTKSTKIAVTVPRGGFRPIPGNTFGKYHPFLHQNMAVLNLIFHNAFYLMQLSSRER